MKTYIVTVTWFTSASNKRMKNLYLVNAISCKAAIEEVLMTGYRSPTEQLSIKCKSVNAVMKELISPVYMLNSIESI